jgi:hypothetical protein
VRSGPLRNEGVFHGSLLDFGARVLLGQAR